MAKYKIIKTKEGSISVNTKKQKRERSEEEMTVIRFVILICVMLLVIVGLYFLTGTMNKQENSEVNTTEEVTVDYAKVNVGTMFNRPYKEYYVIAYDSTSSRAVNFSQIISEYSTKKDAKKIYFCDLSTDINSKYVSEDKTTSITTDYNELSFGDPVLFEVKSGKVGKIYKGEENIKKILK